MTITLDQIITWLIIGALAGSVAAALLTGKRSGYGRITNIAVGLVGAIIGGLIFGLLNINIIQGGITITYQDLIAAFIGAVIFLLLLRFLRR